MNLDLMDSLGLRRGGGYEPAETRYIRDFVRPGSFFIDIGAHIGYHTLNAAAAVGPSGTVLAFEPDRDNFALLRGNVAPFPQVKIVCSAVGGRNGEAALYRNPKNSGDHRIYKVGERLPFGSVHVGRLDDFVRAMSPPDFIKIDAQGSEAAILEGAAETITRSRRLEMIVEFYPAGLEASGEGVDRFFLALAPFTLSVMNRRLGPVPSSESAIRAIAAGSKRAYVNLLCRRGRS